ncbi:RidA family protein [Vannielia litorea]|uniref:RidA family protein n=1 Tax=Vannielia litorea TaxID=1217970 RepID=UPI001BCB7385|nr:RidA family protein [Vannielia litorea]MBS8225476.1 RidA family protein [Vannielia litorea]
MPEPITRMNPATLPDAGAMGYSQISVVEPGRMAFVSGQVATQADGAEPPESLLAQTRLAASNARAALEALGAGPQDIAMLRIYAVDLTPARLAEAYPEITAFLAGARPSVTGIGVAALAAPNLQIELEMVVRLPD